MGPLTLSDGTTWTFFYRPHTQDWLIQIMGPKRGLLYSAELTTLDGVALADYLSDPTRNAPTEESA